MILIMYFMMIFKKNGCSSLINNVCNFVSDWHINRGGCFRRVTAPTAFHKAVEICDR